jgi:hypothetical protein
MALYCPQCKAIRERTGRALRCVACAAALIILPTDHFHSLDPEPTGPQPITLGAMQVSTGTDGSLNTMRFATPGWPPQDS